MNFIEELKRRNVFRVGLAYGVVSWLLLQVADILIDNIGAPDWVFRTLLLVLLIGFPIALIFAWAFEMTPEGIKREKDVDRSQSITRKTGRKLDRMIIVVLALAVGYLLLDKLVLKPGFSESEPLGVTEREEEKPASVAVLPFINMSDSKENEYFSDGLTDTLLHMLAQLPELQVAARTSSFAFKDQNTPIPEIAQVLGVAHILEGSVQRAGDQVRVTAQLIRANDGFHVWSQNYTRPTTDIFAIQDEIAEDVAKALGATLLGESDQRMASIETENIAAYDIYLRGLEQQQIFSWESLENAEDQFKQALILDPEFTDARIALARNYFMMRATGMLTDEDLQRLARPLLARVREDHPDNRLAPLYAHMLENRYGDGAQSMEELTQHLNEIRDLLARVPTESFMRAEIAEGFAGPLNDTAAAHEILDTGLLIDPLEAELHSSKAVVYIGEGNLPAAEVALRRAIELRPENANNYSRMGWLAEQHGDFPAALLWRKKAVEHDPQDPELADSLARDFFSLRMPEEAEPWFQRVQSLAPGSALARALEVMRAEERGETDRAMELAWQALEDQVDARRGAHWQCAWIYGNLMQKQGRSQEAYDRIVALEPRVLVFDSVNPEPQLANLQWMSLMLMAGFASQETQVEAWNQLFSLWDASGFPWREPGNRAVIIEHLVNDDVQAAVDEWINHRFDKPVAQRPWSVRKEFAVIYGPVYDHPTMIAALGQRQREFDEQRKAVEAMLLTPEWNE